MKFACNFCSQEQELDHLAGVQVRKNELANLEKLRKDLEERLNKSEQPDQSKEITERIKKIQQNTKLLKKRFCQNCLQVWKDNAQGEKEAYLPNFRTFVCDVCHITRTGIVTQMRIDAPFVVPPIPKTKLCDICIFCKDNVMETNMAEFNLSAKI